jgi:hypothetical protein
MKTAHKTALVTLMKGGILVVLMLAAIGAWEVYRSTVATPATAWDFDHFKCYQFFDAVPPVPPDAMEGVRLHTQFGVEEGFVLTGDVAKTLCVPAAKEHIPVHPHNVNLLRNPRTPRLLR